MATRPCYAIRFLHIVLSYIFLYDLILSYTLHLCFHSDYRIHSRQIREGISSCLSFPILYFSYTIFSYDFHILCFPYTVHSYYLSYTFRVIDTLFLVLVYWSYTFLFYILYLFIYFSCTVLCTFHILSYTILCPFHILSCTMYFSYIVIFHILSSCTLLLVLVTVHYHRIAVLCFSYHVIYSIHFICIYLSFSFRFHVCKYLRSGYGK